MVGDLRVRLAAAIAEGMNLAAEVAEVVAVDVRNWWARAFGRGAAWDEARDLALVMAAFVARDMGHRDVEDRIREMIPAGSMFRRADDPIRVRQTFSDVPPDAFVERIRVDVRAAMDRAGADRARRSDV